jgi:SAM-dependent methyltransferase
VPFYGPDLAHVHDAAFGALAEAGARELLMRLGEAGWSEGVVVDLGCGTGILGQRVAAAGFDVVGIDVSPDAVALARRRVPGARFSVGRALEAELPPCVAVAAVGEVLGYEAGDAGAGGADALAAVLRRIGAALAPGGLLLLDLAGPGREPAPRRVWHEGEDWLLCLEAREDGGAGVLRRRIAVLRRGAEGSWRRTDEEHVIRLHAPEAVVAALDAAGLAPVTRLAGYGVLAFGAGHAGFLARRA